MWMDFDFQKPNNRHIKNKSSQTAGSQNLL